MFGKTMSIPDEMIGKYYRLASSLTPAEVDKIDAALADGSADPYELKRALGRDLCDTYHGVGAGDEAQAEFDRVFKEGQLADFPEKHVELTVNDEGQIYLAGLLKDLGLSASAGQARRDIDGGGVKGVSCEFPLKPGRVTLMRIGEDRDGGYRLFMAAGTALETEQLLRGTPLQVKFDEKVSDLIETIIDEGVEHHYALIHGDVTAELKLFAKWMGIKII